MTSFRVSHAASAFGKCRKNLSDFFGCRIRVFGMLFSTFLISSFVLLLNLFFMLKHKLSCTLGTRPIPVLSCKVLERIESSVIGDYT